MKIRNQIDRLCQPAIVKEKFSPRSRSSWSLVAALLVLAASGLVVSRIQASTAARVQGTILDHDTRAPVANATIRVDDFDLVTSSDSQGHFSWSSISIDEVFTPTTIVIQAAGYGTWTLQDVLLVQDETLIIDALLMENPQTISIPPISSDRPQGFAAETDQMPLLSAIGAAEDIALPATVRVRVTGNPICNTSLPYTVETVDFKDYVKHVLPNEWISSWPWESLRSGAMAAKMYAWYWIALGGKWNDADVYDSTCDQVYNPAVSYASTNQAVDDTWNWRLTRNDELIQTQYRAFDSQCPSADCMGQWNTRDKAISGWTWDEILAFYYEDTVLTEIWDPPGGYSLRFDGVYNDTENRVLIAVDDPANSDPGPPVDIGSDDFTIEFWLKANPGENNAPSVACGENQNWLQGNLLFDRDRMGADRDYGISLANGRVVFGVSGEGTGVLSICGDSDLADGTWHHVVVQRRLSDGYLWLFVNGVLEAEGDGPDGDVSYPDDYVPGSSCGPAGTASCLPFDPFLALGAEKHRQASSSPSFKGWLDEIRFSSVLRYGAEFTPPTLPFTTDPDTAALYHFDEGVGNLIHDTSGASGGPSDGTRIYGGAINGPEWSLDTKWYVPPPTPTPTPTFTPPTTTATATQTPTATPTTTVTNTTGIVVDHDSVALFEQIPDSYLDAAASMAMLFMDRSVGGNIDDGLTCLGYESDEIAPNNCVRYDHVDPRYSVDPSEVDWSRPGGYDRSNWDFAFWPDDCAEWYDKVECFLDYIDPQMGDYDVVSYQFSYLSVDESSTIADNPGGFFSDNPSLFDVYDQEAYEALHPGKTFIYWTTSLSRGIGTSVSESFNDQMRAYATTHGKVLFDVADIEVHDPDGNLCYDNRDGVFYDNGNSSENYPNDGVNTLALCPQYTTEVDGGHLGSVSAGKIRIAKAFWVLMAQLAGWDPGVAQPPGSTNWYLAEGFTGAGFSTFILIQNPNSSPADVTVTYMLDDGTNITRNHAIPANSRYTIAAHDPAEVGPDQAFATRIDSDQPVIVERAMYWADGGHGTVGFTP